MLLLRRRSELVATWPDELGDERPNSATAVATAVAEHPRRRYGSDREMARVSFAIVDVPDAA